MFLGCLQGMRWSAIGQCFSHFLLTVPDVFVKVNSLKFPLRVCLVANGQIKNRIYSPDCKIHEPRAVGHDFL